MIKAAINSSPAAEQKMYGYIRVSTREQNEARQVIALREFGVPQDCVFMDKQSGKDFQRPAYQALLAALSPGDVLVVKSIDRLGRNYDEILEQWRMITKEKGAAIVVLDMPLLDATMACSPCSSPTQRYRIREISVRTAARLCGMSPIRPSGGRAGQRVDKTPNQFTRAPFP
jgi:hypothetical protein